MMSSDRPDLPIVSLACGSGSAPMTPKECYDALVETLLHNEEVRLGSPGKKGFGQSALQIRGSIFAMLSKGRLVVKLLRQRVDAFITAGVGERFDPRHDSRLMRE